MVPVIYAAVHIATGLERGEEAKDIAETLSKEVVKILKLDETEWMDRIEFCRGLVSEADAFI